MARRTGVARRGADWFRYLNQKNQTNQMSQMNKSWFVHSTILTMAVFSHWRRHDDRDGEGQCSESAAGARGCWAGRLGGGIVGLGLPASLVLAGAESIELLVGAATVFPADGGDAAAVF